MSQWMLRDHDIPAELMIEDRARGAEKGQLRLVEVKVSIAEPNPAISIFHDWGAYRPFGPYPTSGLIRIVWRAHRRKIRAVGSLEIASGAGGLPFFQLQPEDVVMRVQDLMAREVHSCQAEDSLETAAQLMWDHDCGCIPVGQARGAGARAPTERHHGNRDRRHPGHHLWGSDMVHCRLRD